MNLNFNLPTRIVSGDGCVKGNSALFALGKKAFIVCGRSSAKLCGALDDVICVLDSLGIDYEIFNKIMENPTVDICFDGGCRAREVGADFIIGIGGGSPLDASKAIAAFASDASLEKNDIFSDKVNALKSILPIIAIPTTAGTGSEVDPVAVMTLDSGKVKKSFKTSDTYPKYAFLDAKYTETMNIDCTMSTALDALCHCIESYFSPKSNLLSRMFALNGAQIIYSTLKEIVALEGFKDFDILRNTMILDDMNEEELAKYKYTSFKGERVVYLDSSEPLKPFREDLLIGSTLGGLAIGITGTGFNHPLGYNLTLYKSIPHGAACGAFMAEYLACNASTTIGESLGDELARGLKDELHVIGENIAKWSACENIKLTDAEIDEYIENVKGAKNYANSPYVINETEMREIYVRLFGEK